MKHIKITSLPSIRFAHIYSTPKYINVLPKAKNRIEISYISEGEISFSKGGNTFTAAAGDVIVCLYDFNMNIAAEAPHSHHTVCAEIEWTETESPSELLIPDVIKSPHVRDRIRRMIDELIYSQCSEDIPTIKRSADFLDLLCEIDAAARADPETDPASATLSPGEYITAKAKKYVADHIREPITEKDAAEYLGISPGYFCAVFSRAQGMNFIKYVNMMKLEGIRSLMDNAHATLHDAALSFGYSDPNYVSRLHKQIFGHNITEKLSRA